MVKTRIIALAQIAGLLLLSTVAAGQKTSGGTKATGHGKFKTGAPAVNLSATNLSFGSVTVSTTSPAQVVTLTNTGTLALSISSIVTTSPFANTTTCTSSLAAGSSCTISITFTPASAVAYTGTTTLTDNAQGSPQVISLSGLGGAAAAPIVQLSVTSLTFAGQQENTTSQPQFVTVKNVGTATLNISSIVTSGAIFADTTTCGSTLAAAASCSITITFTPNAVTSFTATTTVTDDAADSPQVISLSGTGIATGSNPVVNLSTTSIAFGSQVVNLPTLPVVITLTNVGTGPLAISSIAITGTDTTDFAETTTCGSSLAAGVNCTISPTFTPLSAASFTAAVTITDNAAGSPHVVSLGGTGVTALFLSSPVNLSDFSNTPTSNITLSSAVQHNGNDSMQIHYNICGLPNIPTLSQSAGGSLGATTYYVKLTAVDSTGETTPSAEVHLAVAANNVLVVTLPAAQPTGITGINVYVGTSSGTETKQTASPTAQASTWTEPTSGLVAGASAPTVFGITDCGTQTQDSNRWMSKLFTSQTDFYTRAYLYQPTPLGADANIANSQYVQRKLLWWSDSSSATSNLGNYQIFLTSWTTNAGTFLPASFNLQLGTQYTVSGTCPASGLGWYATGNTSMNAWHEVEVYLHLNTVGLSDGTASVTVDGSTVLSKTGINLRGACTNGISFAAFGEQANRYNWNSLDEERYWNDLVIATIPIP